MKTKMGAENGGRCWGLGGASVPARVAAGCWLVYCSGCGCPPAAKPAGGLVQTSRTSTTPATLVSMTKMTDQNHEPAVSPLLDEAFTATDWITFISSLVAAVAAVGVALATAGLFRATRKGLPHARKSLQVAREERYDDIEQAKRVSLGELVQSLLDAEGEPGLAKLGSIILFQNPGKEMPLPSTRTITMILVDSEPTSSESTSSEGKPFQVMSILFHYSQTDDLPTDVELAISNVFEGYKLTAADAQALQDRQAEGTADFKHILKIDQRYICVLGIQPEQIHPRGQPDSKQKGGEK